MSDTVKIREKIKQELLNNDVQFNEKVIHTIDSEYQSYHFEMSVLIPIKHPLDGDRFVKLHEPSMTQEQALDLWLDNILKE